MPKEERLQCLIKNTYLLSKTITDNEYVSIRHENNYYKLQEVQLLSGLYRQHMFTLHFCAVAVEVGRAEY